MFSPQTPEGIRALVASLKRAGSEEEYERYWCRPITDYGFRFAEPDGDPIHDGPLSDFEYENVEPTIIDPNDVVYVGSNQPILRLEVLKHYLDSSQLFDPNPWFDTPYPIMSPWLDKYIGWDGHHRIAADRIMKRSSKVIIARLKNQQKVN